MDPRGIIEEALIKACEFLPTLKEGGNIVERGVGFGDLENDTSIKADVEVDQAILDSLRRTKQNFKVISEEGEYVIGSNPEYLITIDSVDGSLNYRRGGWLPGSALPYTATMAMFDSLKPRFSNALIAGTIDLRNGNLVMAERDNGCYVRRLYGEWSQCKVSGRRTFGDERDWIIVAESYYPDNRRLIAEAFNDLTGWIRNPGSAAYEFALVALGITDAFICKTQKNHELGPAYLLIKEAGGVVTDFYGNDIGGQQYEFNTKTPVVAAATPELLEEILERIQKWI